MPRSCRVRITTGLQPGGHQSQSPSHLHTQTEYCIRSPQDHMARAPLKMESGSHVSGKLTEEVIFALNLFCLISAFANYDHHQQQSLWWEGWTKVTQLPTIQRTKSLKFHHFGGRTESIQQDAQDCSFFRAESFREQVQLTQTLKN